jgi:hypothetical protein
MLLIVLLANDEERGTEHWFGRVLVSARTGVAIGVAVRALDPSSSIFTFPMPHLSMFLDRLLALHFF